MAKKQSIDWRKTTMARIRTLVKEADAKIIVETKYRKPTNPAGIPVWYRDGMICTGETYQNHLRFTFSKGNLLKDPKGLINSYRAMLIKEGDTVNATAFKALIREAVALNQKPKKPLAKKPSKKRV